jgi:2-oxoglutarate ferredoxin oxidoreductase subunit delta
MSRGTIFIEQDRCKGCELCVAVCPQTVIALDENILNVRGYHPAALVDPDTQCTGCGVCAIICPDVCITVYREPVRQRATAS